MPWNGDAAQQEEAELKGDRGLGQTRAFLRVQLAGTALAGLLVFFVEGFNSMALWNVVPLALALGSIAIARGDLGAQEVYVGALLFWASQVASVTFLHAAWYFDWGAVATRSSTAGLIFLVVPVYTVTGGLLLTGLTVLASLALKRRATAAPNKELKLETLDH